MLHILVPGDDKRLMRYKRFECTRCGCIFTASHEEYVNDSNQRDGTMYRCKCPHCKAVVWNYSLECCTEDGKYE